MRQLFSTGAGAPPPARPFADTSPRTSRSSAWCSRKRFCLTTAAIVFAAYVPSAQSGRLLVLNKEDATLVIVDPAAGKILGTVPVGQGPHELVASPDGKWAFAANYGTGPAPGNTISMIDIAAKK